MGSKMFSFDKNDWVSLGWNGLIIAAGAALTAGGTYILSNLGLVVKDPQVLAMLTAAISATGAITWLTKAVNKWVADNQKK